MSNPRVNLTRFHGVFAPNSRLRAHAAANEPVDDASEPSGAHTRRATSTGWARRLRRVFGIDVERCAQCGGQLHIIACIEDRRTVQTILAHLEARGRHTSPASAAPAQAHPRAPPHPAIG